MTRPTPADRPYRGQPAMDWYGWFSCAVRTSPDLDPLARRQAEAMLAALGRDLDTAETDATTPTQHAMCAAIEAYLTALGQIEL